MKYIRHLAILFMFLLRAPFAFAQPGITPEQAPKLAEVAVIMTQQLDNQRLDYSPESLKIIDQLVLKFRKEGNTPQSMNKSMIVFGCYVGEVMVRNLGYKWDMPNDKETAVGFTTIGVRGTNGSFSNPIGKVFKLLQNGEEDSVVLFYNVFSRDFSDIAKDAEVTK